VREGEAGAGADLDAQLRASTRARVRRSNRLATGESTALTISLLCECGACRTWLVVDADLYARAVVGRRRYVVAPGHHLAERERVVLERRDFDVIEVAV
jgi:hypothetical protein